MRQPDLLVLSFHFPPSTGGIENYLYHLTANTPNQVKVITFRVRGWREFDRRQSLRIKRNFPSIDPLLSSPALFKSMLIPLNIALFFSGWKEISKHRCDIIVAGSADSCPAACWLSNRLDLPFLAIVYGKDVIPRGGKSLWKKLVTHRCLRRASLVFTISDFTRRILLEAGIAPDRIKVITPGLDPSSLPVTDQNTDRVDRTYNLRGKPVLLTTGRLIARKGHQKVIEALPELIKRFPEITYLIVGEGPYRQQLENKVRSLGLERNVLFTGYLTQAELAACYQRCQIMAMPSQSDTADVEGFGIVYLEAGLFSKPVIGIRGGGVTDAIQDGITGFLIEPGDQEALIRAIFRLLEDKGLAGKLGRAGREKALLESWPLKSKTFSEMIAGVRREGCEIIAEKPR